MKVAKTWIKWYVGDLQKLLLIFYSACKQFCWWVTNNQVGHFTGPRIHCCMPVFFTFKLQMEFKLAIYAIEAACEGNHHLCSQLDRHSVHLLLFLVNRLWPWLSEMKEMHLDKLSLSGNLPTKIQATSLRQLVHMPLTTSSAMPCMTPCSTLLLKPQHWEWFPICLCKRSTLLSSEAEQLKICLGLTSKTQQMVLYSLFSEALKTINSMYSRCHLYNFT